MLIWLLILPFFAIGMAFSGFLPLSPFGMLRDVAALPSSVEPLSVRLLSWFYLLVPFVGYRSILRRRRPTLLRRAILPISLLLLLFLFMHACVPKPITNLKAVEVSRLPASSLPLTEDLRKALTERGEAVWKISLMGDAEWIGEIKEHELNSYATVVRCDDRDYNVFSLGPYAGQLPVTYYGEGFSDFQPSGSAVRYDIYLPEAGNYRSEADFNASMPSYDFSMEALTLCIRIAGGAMHGAYNHSNEVRVRVGGET